MYTYLRYDEDQHHIYLLYTFVMSYLKLGVVWQKV